MEHASRNTASDPSGSVNRRTVYHRVPDVMRHIPRYWFDGKARLAADAGVSRSALGRFLSGQANPSYAHVHAVLGALERRLGRDLDFREIVSMDGTYPTQKVCQLLGCHGCSPVEVYESEAFSRTTPGQFSRPERLLPPARSGGPERSPEGEPR